MPIITYKNRRRRAPAGIPVAGIWETGPARNGACLCLGCGRGGTDQWSPDGRLHGQRRASDPALTVQDHARGLVAPGVPRTMAYEVRSGNVGFGP